VKVRHRSSTSLSGSASFLFHTVHIARPKDAPLMSSPYRPPPRFPPSSKLYTRNPTRYRRPPHAPSATALPDLSTPILLILGATFTLLYLYFFGLPIALSLALRKIRKMGLFGWLWGGGEREDGSGKPGASGTMGRRRRAGGLEKEVVVAATCESYNS
jgi:hypothetical protein